MSKKTTTKSTKTSSKAAAKPEAKAQSRKAAAPTKGKPAPKKAPPEKEVAEAQVASLPGQKTAATSATKAAPRSRDPRLPAPGTVLQKKDRHGNVRCECSVEQDGIHYKGTLYRSLSAAAMAASKDLGLGGSANGFLFWGLIKQESGARRNAVAALEHAWERYRERASGAVAGAKDDDNRARIKDAITRQASALAKITQAL